MRGDHEEAKRMAVNQGGQEQPVYDALGRPGGPTERKQHKPREARQEHKPGIHPGFLRVINQRWTDRGQPGGPAPGCVVERPAAKQVNGGDRGQPAKDAEGSAGEVRWAEEAEPGVQHQRMQRRAGAVDLVEACEQGGGLSARATRIVIDLVVPEARAVQVPEPQPAATNMMTARGRIAGTRAIVSDFRTVRLGCGSRFVRINHRATPLLLSDNRSGPPDARADPGPSEETAMNRLHGKVAVITGAGAGIGRATAELFAEEGAAVVIAERDDSTGREAAERIKQAGGRALFVQTDVADESSCERMAAEAVAAFGAIHILVNNAAIFILRGIDATPEEWRQMLDVNVMGPALVAKHVVPAIRKAGGGAIVNLASISSFIAQPNFVTYNTTKAAILGMTRCMAMDLAPDNIRVNDVCPGVVWTQIVERQAIAMGLDRAAADVHPQWAGAS